MCFELGEALERHADGAGHPGRLQLAEQLVAAEGAVHTRKNRAQVRTSMPRLPGEQGRTWLMHSLMNALDERLGAVGIVHVARAVEHREHLAGLGHGAVQRVVAALSLLLVEADGGAFGAPPGAEHRAVEIEREARGGQHGEPIEHQLGAQRLEPFDALLVEG